MAGGVPSARNGTAASRNDHFDLLGFPQKTMTMHYKALKHVDGSLTADDEGAEERWIRKVRVMCHCGYIVY